MPSETPPPPAQDSARRSPRKWRHQRHDDPQALNWPINEILLETLVLAGKSDAQIAEMCGVRTDQVCGLRKAYGI